MKTTVKIRFQDEAKLRAEDEGVVAGKLNVSRDALAVRKLRNQCEEAARELRVAANALGIRKAPELLTRGAHRVTFRGLSA